MPGRTKELLPLLTVSVMPGPGRAGTGMPLVGAHKWGCRRGPSARTCRGHGSTGMAASAWSGDGHGMWFTPNPLSVEMTAVGWSSAALSCIGQGALGAWGAVGGHGVVPVGKDGMMTLAVVSGAGAEGRGTGGTVLRGLRRGGWGWCQEGMVLGWGGWWSQGLPGAEFALGEGGMGGSTRGQSVGPGERVAAAALAALPCRAALRAQPSNKPAGARPPRLSFGSTTRPGGTGMGLRHG